MNRKTHLVLVFAQVIFLCIGRTFANPSAQSPDIYAAHRDSLLAKIQHGVVLLAAAPQAIRNGDVEYKYRQNSDFYYLTGFSNPGAYLVLRPDTAPHYILFVRSRNPTREIYTGSRPGISGAMTKFGADTAYTVEKLHQELPRLIGDSGTFYLPLNQRNAIQEQYDSILENSAIQPDTLVNVSNILHRMRLVKSDHEIHLIQKAIDITNDAQQEMMRVTAPDKYEYQISAAIKYVFTNEGATAPSFPSIVASGKNATTLHYFENNAKLQNTELLLVDIGTEYQMYAADITRTIPVSGKFSPEQKALYQAVLNVQKRAIEAVRPGVTIDHLNDLAQRETIRELLKLDILHGDLDSLVEAGAGDTFLPHGISHHLGMDAHDPGGYAIWQTNLPLKPGMVITIEPGIYIRSGMQNVDPKWHNIGIRIEDDILVTKTGRIVLSHDIPKSVKAIEKEMRRKPRFIKQ